MNDIIVVDIVEQAPINVQIEQPTPVVVKVYEGAVPGGGGTWGSITGTLSDQTDLQTALNTKVDKVTGKGLSTNDLTDLLKAAYDAAVSWITTNGTNLINHLSNTNNPHSTTATQTDALKRDGSNANSDIDINSYSFNAKSLHVKGTGGAGHLGLKHQSTNASANTNETSLFSGSDGELYYKNDSLTLAQIASRAWVTSLGYITSSALVNYLLKNTPITAATKTKITYDANGLVTSGADATTADINDSTNRRYVSDAQLTIIGNTSGTNSGNETVNTIGTLVNGSADATPNDTDLVATVESSVLKKITWTNVKAFLLAFFDTKYQPKAKYKQCIAERTTSASLTGGVNNAIQLMASILVPAGTINTLDSLAFDSLYTKSGAGGTSRAYVYVNTSASLSGAKQIAFSGSNGATISAWSFFRTAIFVSSTTSTIAIGSGSNIEGTATTQALNNENIDWSIDQYVVIAGQLGNTADVFTLEFIKMYKG